MKITILTYLENPEEEKWDVVVDQVAAALKTQDHSVSILGIHDDIRKLMSGLERRQPDLVFNLMEMFGDNFRGEIGVVGLLDMMQMKYTGGGPGELYLRQDKGLSKKLLAYDKLLYPDFAVFSQDSDLETGGNLRMPLFVKPLRGDASQGITTKALVQTAGELMKQVAIIHSKFKDSALVEGYIEGREFYVGVVGNRQPQALPPVEMDFSGLPEGAPRILDSKAKWETRSKEFKGTKAIMADVPPEVCARLQKVALDAYRALRVRDYGRVDLRMTDTGDIYVIEVNASCYLEAGSEFATTAAAAGIEYPALVNRIAQEALSRYNAGG